MTANKNKPLLQLKLKSFYEQKAAEKEYLHWYHHTKQAQQFPQASVTVDIILCAVDKTAKQLKFMIVKRKRNPARNQWGLPGTFLNPNKSYEQQARDEVKFETDSQDLLFIHQLTSPINPKRDPRGWVISIPYIIGIPFKQFSHNTHDYQVKWSTQDDLPPLAFDHQDLIKNAINDLCTLIHTNPQPYQLLGETFSISDAVALYRACDPNAKVTTSNYTTIYVRNHGWFQPTGETQRSPQGRPSKIIKIKK